MLDTFTRHPQAVGETYGQHFVFAASFGASMVIAGLACLVHAVLPFAFERTASHCVQRLHGRLLKRGGPATS